MIVGGIAGEALRQRAGADQATVMAATVGAIGAQYRSSRASRWLVPCSLDNETGKRSIRIKRRREVEP